ncbi:MAG: citrate synthase [Candidatus Bathyarchaeota archaeon]|nr:citrate synthase [Candidatus Bathyarchaeota archaeon]
MCENDEKSVVRGLRDVAAAETKISYVNPNGFLYYLGYNIDDIVGQAFYAEIAYLLIHRNLPNKQELDTFCSQLFNEMHLPEPIIKSIHATPKNCPPMDVLRTEVSHLGEYDPDIGDYSTAANMRRATRLVAQVPTIVATLHRSRQNLPVPEPKKEFAFSKNFLYMFKGEVPDDKEASVIHRFMILHADHGFNASTFAARVTASTNSDMYSAITSAIGTLKGPLHGGASEKVMDMLDEINLEAEVEEYIQGLLDEKKKIMGFGHRVYKAQDPRTKHLRGIVEDFCHRERSQGLYNRCMTIERLVYEKKKIYPNVDFYAAVAMDALGVQKAFFPLFFASARISGWVAHVLEQYEDAVLLRPQGHYVGEFERTFVPLEQR